MVVICLVARLPPQAELTSKPLVCGGAGGAAFWVGLGVEAGLADALLEVGFTAAGVLEEAEELTPELELEFLFFLLIHLFTPEDVARSSISKLVSRRDKPIRLWRAATAA